MSILPVHVEEVTAVAKLRVDIPVGKFSGDESPQGYETEGSHGVVYRIREPKAVSLIYPDGNIVCTGTKSVRDAEEAMRQTIEKVRSLGVDVPSDAQVKIEKIVAAFRLAESIDLQKAASYLKGAVYEPEKLDAIVYRDAGSEFLIKGDGRIICTGERSIKDMQVSFRRLTEALESAGIKAELA
jgi:transcription initiation factor TFIID TATA-box-binding protein